MVTKSPSRGLEHLKKSRKARTGRNPRTNEPINIPEAFYPSFKAGKILKDRVNKKK